MAGHSKFKNIMHRKGAQDKKRAKIFTKLVREIFVAAKSGMPDPKMNPTLRAAIISARGANMPKDRIDGAIAKATSSNDSTNYEEIRYEGYGIGGVAIIVEALTDNRNRAASEVRSTFTKHGGSLGETGSVNFMFQRVGIIQYPITKGSAEVFLEAAIDLGANDCISEEDCHEVVCPPDQLARIRDAFEERFGAYQNSQLSWKPLTLISIDAAQAENIIKLIDALEDLDDVQNVFANFDIPEDVMLKLNVA